VVAPSRSTRRWVPRWRRPPPPSAAAPRECNHLILRPGQRAIVVGDVHGCIDEFQLLLAKVPPTNGTCVVPYPNMALMIASLRPGVPCVLSQGCM
jgi:hypothetical protein